MSGERNQRPGGVTTLAVINFLHFGMWGLSLVGTAIEIWGGGAVGATGYASDFNLNVDIGLTVAGCIFLLLSGIGLLGGKKFMGRHLTTVLLALVVASAVFLIKNELPKFSLMSAAVVVWQTLATILVNTVFKEDLIK